MYGKIICLCMVPYRITTQPWCSDVRTEILSFEEVTKCIITVGNWGIITCHLFRDCPFFGGPFIKARSVSDVAIVTILYHGPVTQWE